MNETNEDKTLLQKAREAIKPKSTPTRIGPPSMVAAEKARAKDDLLKGKQPRILFEENRSFFENEGFILEKNGPGWIVKIP